MLDCTLLKKKSRTSLFMKIPRPTMQAESALFLNRVTASGKFIISMAAKSGGLAQPRSPSAEALHCRRALTRLCTSSTFDSIRRSRGTYEASHSIASPLDDAFGALPRYKNLSLFQSFFSVASFTRNCSTWDDRVQVICDSPPKRGV